VAEGHSTWEARTGGWGPCPQLDSDVWVWGIRTPEADDTFCENVQFCHAFKNDVAIFAFIPTSVQYKMEEKSIWMQKSGRTSNNACPLGTKSGPIASAANVAGSQEFEFELRFHVPLDAK